MNTLSPGESVALRHLMEESAKAGSEGVKLEDTLIGNETEEIFYSIAFEIDGEVDRAMAQVEAAALESAAETVAGASRVVRCQIEFNFLKTRDSVLNERRTISPETDE